MPTNENESTALSFRNSAQSKRSVQRHIASRPRPALVWEGRVGSPVDVEGDLAARGPRLEAADHHPQRGTRTEASAGFVPRQVRGRIDVDDSLSRADVRGRVGHHLLATGDLEAELNHLDVAWWRSGIGESQPKRGCVVIG